MISKEDNILLTAEKLFAQKGFMGTSTREISKEAGVNISMISYYFGSKEQLLEKIIEVRMGQGLAFGRELLENKTLNAWEKLTRMIDRYAEIVKSLKDFHMIMQREQLSNRNPKIVAFVKESKITFLSNYKTVISEGIEAGIFKKSPDIFYLHALVTGTLYTAQNSLPLYESFFEEENAEQLEQKIKNNLIQTLKFLLGYDED